MTKKFSQVVRKASHELAYVKKPKNSKLLVLVLLAIALPMIVIISFQSQDFRQRASEPITAPVQELVFKKAAQLNGGHLTVANSSTLVPRFGFTVEAWIKPPLKDDNIGTIVSKEATDQNSFALRVNMEKNPGGATYRTSYNFLAADNATSRCDMYAANYVTNYSPSDFEKWRHVAGVIQPNGRMEIFVDGQKVTQVSHTLSGVCAKFIPVNVGARIWASPSSQYYGAIDELRISKIARYTDSFTPSKEPFTTDANTELLWHFDGTVSDESSNGRAGQIVGDLGFVESAIITPAITPSASPSAALTPTAVPTAIASPSATNIPSPTLTYTPTPTPTEVPTATPTNIPSPTYTLTPTPTRIPTLTPTPTRLPTLTPTPTRVPTLTPTPTQEPTPTRSNPPTPTDEPTLTITPVPPTNTLTPSPTPVPCTITSAQWGKSSTRVNEGTLLRLEVIGSPTCSGKQVSFVVRENDSLLEGLGDDPTTLQPVSVNFSMSSQPRATSSWVAEWQSDCNGWCLPPEYFFVASLPGNTGNVRSQDPLIEVQQSNSPKLTISQPLPGVAVSGTTVSVAYSASGNLNGSAASHVNLKVDGQPELQNLPLKGLQQFTKLTAGNHTVTGYLARKDQVKLEGTETSVTFTIIPPTPTPTPRPVARLRVNASSISIKIKQGDTKPAITLVSTGAKSYRLEGKPVITNENIRWEPAAGNLTLGQPITLRIATGNNARTGIYKGTAVIIDTSLPNSVPLSIPVTVTVNKN